MNAFLEQRISNLLGPETAPAQPLMMAEGGEVFDIEDPDTMAEASMAMQEPPGDPNAELRDAIDQLMIAQQTAEDPFESRKAEQLMEAAVIGSEAPLGTMALELSQAGRGGDSTLAHLTPGEVVLPLGMMDDPDFERIVENRFEEMDLNPEEYVVGLGIASLNPVTGLEEFGFFKKIAKGVKKVVKKVVRPVAAVAQFVPGPWQPVAALINKAGTVYDVASGNASPLALASLATGAGGTFSQNIKDLRALSTAAGGSGSIIDGIVKAATQSGSSIQSGIGNLLSDPTKTIFGSGAGTLRGLAGSASFSGQSPKQMLEAIAEDPTQAVRIETMRNTFGMSDEEILSEMTGGQAGLGGLISGGGRDGVGNYGALGDFMGSITDRMGLTDYGLADGQGGFGAGGGRGGFGMGDAAAFGLAGLLAKLAYDEAKDRKGVQLTPSVVMNAAGRFNLENEIARRAGTQAPNPVEFGLLPQGNIPVLSGGRVPTTAQAELEREKVEGMRYGGPVMAFAEGGNVDEQDFKRMNGDINGPGTEVSDDIPAMLSDGEFVMTGRAVRGAGAFDMKNKNGIITLTPKNGEDRERGTKLMYEMMDLFKEFADAPEAVA